MNVKLWPPEGEYNRQRFDEARNVRVLRTVTEIEQIRSFWEAMPGSRDSDIDFYLTVLCSSPTVVRPHVLVVSRGQVPETILIGRIDHRATDFTIGYLKINSDADILFFVDGAIRGDPSVENARLLVAEICNNLAAGEADIADLNLLSSDSNLFKLSRTVPGFWNRDHVSHFQPHFKIDIPHDVATFQGSLSHRVRKNQRCQANRLVREFRGDVKIHCFTKPSDVDELIRVAHGISKTSYQNALGVGFEASAETRARLQLEADKGWLRGYVLYAGGLPCAFLIGDIYQENFRAHYTGYEPSVARYSPGMYTIMQVIEGFCSQKEESVRSLDFGSGYAQYKEFVGHAAWHEAQVYIYALSIRGLKLKGLRIVSAAVKSVVSRTVRQGRLLNSIKKTWRVQLTRKAMERSEDR